jgi:lysophospholipase-3
MTSLSLLAAVFFSCLGLPAIATAQAIQSGGQKVPVVLFPAYYFTKLRVKVARHHLGPGCPNFVTLEHWFGNRQPSTVSQTCRDRLLTLVSYRSGHSEERFDNQPGVTVEFKDYGRTASAPFYEPMYAFLEAAGYTRDRNIRVAGYDSRLTPDLGGFLQRTIDLIEETYRQNQDTPVHLVGHSNGPLYAQFLLTHTSQRWKSKYIHGFTPVAGNWAGQGIFYPVFFTGLNITDFSFPADAANAKTSATMHQSHPSTYMSSADPAVFGNQEVVLQAAGESYTPRDYREVFRDAGLGPARELATRYIGLVRFQHPAFFPDVDVYAEKGSGFPTAVGMALPNLTVGQVVGPSTVFFTRDGDSNQEDITNNAIQVWRQMRCFRFELTDNPAVDHFSLPGNPAVLQRLLTNLQRPRSVCSSFSQ